MTFRRATTRVTAKKKFNPSTNILCLLGLALFKATKQGVSGSGRSLKLSYSTVLWASKSNQKKRSMAFLPINEFFSYPAFCFKNIQCLHNTRCPKNISPLFCHINNGFFRTPGICILYAKELDMLIFSGTKILFLNKQLNVKVTKHKYVTTIIKFTTWQLIGIVKLVFWFL